MRSQKGARERRKEKALKHEEKERGGRTCITYIQRDECEKEEERVGGRQCTDVNRNSKMSGWE